MAHIVIELTNRCNLSCKHCLEGRHGANGGNLKIEIIQKILQGAMDHGFDRLSFTGGEPTVHPRFMEILGMANESGYKFGFVTNGWDFTSIYEELLPYRDRLTIITFSLDGAREATHDRIRGKGSYRRVMKAVSVCIVKDIPFTFNTLITSHTLKELKELTLLATKLGSRGLRFGYLIPTSQMVAEELDISPEEKRETESSISQLQKTSHIPIVMAHGYYTTDLFPCAPLQMQECNIDWRGNITPCCHLSGHGEDVISEDVIDNLEKVSFSEAYQHLVKFTSEFKQEKLERHCSDELIDTDLFPCWYCLNYFGKLEWLKEYCENPWSRYIWTEKTQRRSTIHAGA